MGGYVVREEQISHATYVRHSLFCLGRPNCGGDEYWTRTQKSVGLCPG